jgi:hypothetical protein
MPTTNTWDLNVTYPAYQSVASGGGRWRVWNNTLNLKSYGPDDKPVNGYGDRQYKGQQSMQTLQTRPASGGALTTTYGPAYNSTLGDVCARPQSWSNSQFGDFNSIISTCKNAARLKALVKIADAKVNLPVAFAEASKTSDLILGTARRIDRAYRAFRKGNLKGIAENLGIAPRKLHNSWLEYKYGWMPLLMDVKGAAEFFAQQHVQRNPRFHVVAREQFLKNSSFQVTDAAYGGGTGTKTYSIFVSTNIVVTVKIWCELTSPHFSELQQLGMTNPALVVWELIPFSFVFDWFISVGDWLTGITALQGVTVRRAMESVVRDHAGTLTLPPYENTVGSTTYIDTGFTNVASQRWYDRGTYSPTEFDLWPPVTNNFGFQKLVTSLALLRANYRGSSARL